MDIGDETTERTGRTGRTGCPWCRMKDGVGATGAGFVVSFWLNIQSLSPFLCSGSKGPMIWGALGTADQIILEWLYFSFFRRLSILQCADRCTVIEKHSLDFRRYYSFFHLDDDENIRRKSIFKPQFRSVCKHRAWGVLHIFVAKRLIWRWWLFSTREICHF